MHALSFKLAKRFWSSLSNNALHYKAITNMWLALLHLVEDSRGVGEQYQALALAMARVS